MADIVRKFGEFVDAQIPAHPDAARRLLLAAYYAKRVQLQKFPSGELWPARNDMAVTSMNAVIHPLAHPEQTGLVSIFTPCELLQTFGIYPMLAEAMACYITGADAERGFIDFACEEGIPETFCSYHKVLLGAVLSNVIRKPRFVLNTSLACDANNLTFRTAAEHYGIPHFYLDVPWECSEEAVAYTAEQLRTFASFLEEDQGKPLNMPELQRRIAIGGRTMKKLAACQVLKRDKYLSNDLTDELYEVFANHVLLGTPEVERFADQLLQDLRDAKPSRGIRLLWMHTIPFYQEPLRELMNFSNRCQIVACDMNFDEYCQADPEKPFESMARRLVYDSFNGPSERRIRRSLAMCRKLQVDGVVYFCHWGCKQTAAASQNAKGVLEENGYPTLILDGDGCDAGNSSNGQIATRMQAFIEMLEDRKQAQKR
ncbi:MAG: 2-hydroxyacyl-CoA dehydratase family protein [Eubacterium sp.]|nr:2-hydroxyacyl-CoA dehydratase family protein [Eubacterium sp.]